MTDALAPDLPLDHLDDLVELVAASPAFREFAGAGDDVAAARRRILLGYANDDADDPEHGTVVRPPRAILQHADGRTLRKTGSTGWDLEADLSVLFEFEPPQHLDHNAQFRAMREHVDRIVWDFMQLSGTPRTDGAPRTHLNVVRLQERIPPTPGDPKYQAGRRWWFAEWTLGIQ